MNTTNLQDLRIRVSDDEHADEITSSEIFDNMKRVFPKLKPPKKQKKRKTTKGLKGTMSTLIIDWNKVPLGLLHDNHLCRSLGVSCDTVGKRRNAGGIKVFVRSRQVDNLDDVLGLAEDEDIAASYGLRKDSVARRRNRLKIKSFHRDSIIDTHEAEKRGIGLQLKEDDPRLDPRAEYRTGQDLLLSLSKKFPSVPPPGPPPIAPPPIAPPPIAPPPIAPPPPRPLPLFPKGPCRFALCEVAPDFCAAPGSQAVGKWTKGAPLKAGTYLIDRMEGDQKGGVIHVYHGFSSELRVVSFVGLDPTVKYLLECNPNMTHYSLDIDLYR